ncbi:AcrR family transcriptional regulator [Parvibaculum indicum]|uniref:TetR/AcrR family transcriptional regulator n=1 Tax=Parvibaculum indicum TaxID=562969 RepID=UPI0014237F71|nr:TetR/AcrR family transcriptional regulator [Parvibaculum indicum]NIJ40438.1 AcrR family transcriptional regulator [Parvibaculum indicum]
MIYIFPDSGEFSPAVAQNRARKMREILSVALDLAVEGGLDNLTLHGLADRMGRSVAAVYRYYPSKEAVVRELQRLVATHIGVLNADTAERIDDWAREKDLSKQDLALAQVIGSAKTYELFALASPAEFGLVTHYLGNPADVLPEQDVRMVFDVTRENLKRLAEFIADAQDKGAIGPGDARERTLMIWGALQGTIQLLKVTRRGAAWGEAETLPDATLHALLQGWGASKARLNIVSSEIEREALAAPTRQVRDLLTPEKTSTPKAAD